MSARMPIAQALQTGQTRLLQYLRNEIAAVPFFDIQVAEDVMSRASERANGYSLRECGVVRPPYPSMWMEFGFPVDGSRVGIHLIERAQLSTTSWLDPDNAYTVNGRPADLLMLPVVWGVNETITSSLDVLCLTFDKDGRPLDWVTFSERRDPLTLELIEEYFWMVATVTTALGLINCRNVSTVESGRIALRRSGTEKRRGVPAKEIRYSTIELPGGGSVYDKASGTHRATALHRVRGHFKTFTAERPLMGKYVGTYWWGWQVRGNSDNGAVIGEYNLEGARP
jgi:hypothetical protein